MKNYKQAIESYKNNTKPEQTQHLATQYQQFGTHYKNTILPSDAIILQLYCNFL